MMATISTLIHSELTKVTLAAVGGGFSVYIGLWNSVNDNAYTIKSHGEKIELIKENNSETKETLKEINNELVEIKILIAKTLRD